MRNDRWAVHVALSACLLFLMLGGCSSRSRLENKAMLEELETIQQQLNDTRQELDSVKAKIKAMEEGGLLNNSFTSASLEFRVPVDLLKTISYVESRWGRFDSSPSIDGKFGLMGLSRDQTLPMASEYLGLSLESIRISPRENIRGGALVLRRLYRQRFGEIQPPEDPTQWYEILGDYSGFAEDSLRKMYADEVMKFLQNGVTDTSLGETITVRPHAKD